jgi:hypothetical protein
MSFIKSLLYSLIITALIGFTWALGYEIPSVWFLSIGIMSLVPLAILIHVIRLLTAILEELKKANK